MMNPKFEQYIDLLEFWYSYCKKWDNGNYKDFIYNANELKFKKLIGDEGFSYILASDYFNVPISLSRLTLKQHRITFDALCIESVEILNKAATSVCGIEIELNNSYYDNDWMFP